MEPRFTFVNAFIGDVISWASTGPVVDALASFNKSRRQTAAPIPSTSATAPRVSRAAAALPLIDVLIAHPAVVIPLHSNAHEALTLELEGVRVRSCDLYGLVEEAFEGDSSADKESVEASALDSAASSYGRIVQATFRALSVLAVSRFTPAVDFASLFVGRTLDQWANPSVMPACVHVIDAAKAGSRLHVNIAGVQLCSYLTPRSELGSRRAHIHNSATSALTSQPLMRDVVLWLPNLVVSAGLPPVLPVQSEIPTPISVSVRFAGIGLALSQRQWAFIMAMLAQNIGENKPPVTFDNSLTALRPLLEPLPPVVLAMLPVPVLQGRVSSSPQLNGDTPVPSEPPAASQQAATASSGSALVSVCVSVSLPALEVHVIQGDVAYSLAEARYVFDHRPHDRTGPVIPPNRGPHASTGDGITLNVCASESALSSSTTISDAVEPSISPIFALCESETQFVPCIIYYVLSSHLKCSPTWPRLRHRSS